MNTFRIFLYLDKIFRPILKSSKALAMFWGMERYTGGPHETCLPQVSTTLTWSNVTRTNSENMYM
jgi:hypothetical protein